MRFDRALAIDDRFVDDFIKEYGLRNRKWNTDEEYEEIYEEICKKLEAILKENNCEFYLYFDNYGYYVHETSSYVYCDIEELASIVMDSLE